MVTRWAGIKRLITVSARKTGTMISNLLTTDPVIGNFTYTSPLAHLPYLSTQLILRKSIVLLGKASFC